MAISIQSASSRSSFDRHIKRLVWCALIGSLALLIPMTGVPVLDTSGLVGALGALVVVVAGLTVVRDVSRYVHGEAVRRAEGARRFRHDGACQAAEVIQDRVGNLLSITVGYVDFLLEDAQLSTEARQQAERALESALAATRAVSTFRQSLGCGPSSLAKGRSATERTSVDELRERRTDRLIAEAPAVRDALGAAQQLLAALRAGAPRPVQEEARITAVLEQVTIVLERLDG